MWCFRQPQSMFQVKRTRPSPRRISGRTYVEMLEAVTADDVRKFVQQLLRSKPSLAAYGDNTQSLDPSVLARRYG